MLSRARQALHQQRTSSARFLRMTTRASMCELIPSEALRSVVTSPQFRVGAFALGTLVVWLYQKGLGESEAAGAPSWRTTQSKVRLRWAQYVMETKGYLYAIQTLRNAITSTTFLATTVLSLFTLCVSYLWQHLQTKFSWYLVAQFGSAALCLLCSSFYFTQSARLLTHAGFMFPVASDAEAIPEPNDCNVNEADALIQAVMDSSGWKGTKEEAEAVVSAALQAAQPPPQSPLVPGITEASACALMVKSEKYQWLGLRYLYYCGPCIAWVLCGEPAYLLACLGLVRFLKLVDKPVPSTFASVASW